MNKFRFVMGGVVVALAPVAAAAEPISSPHASLGAVTKPQTVSPYGTWGFHPTQWRAFPSAGVSPAKAEDPKIPPSQVDYKPAVRGASPTPAALLGSRGKTGGFATQRGATDPVVAATAVVPKPTAPAPSNDTLRNVKPDDGVMRADWPVIPPVRK